MEDINKFFHLDYGDIYHKHDPDLKLDFTKKLESTQYSAALALSGAWRESSRQKLYDELGCHRKWYSSNRNLNPQVKVDQAGRPLPPKKT